MATAPINTPPGSPAPAADSGHAGHGAGTAAPNTGQATFSSAYARALANVDPSRSASPLNAAPAVSRHIPIGKAGHSGGHDLHERALALRGERLELLAANIANADTPGYKAVDIDVEAALRAGETAETVQVMYRIPLQPSIDGNTVEMEVERAQFADAAVRYQFSLDRALKHYMHISELLKDLKE